MADLIPVRRDDLHKALIGNASAYGAHQMKDGKYVLDWFGRLADAFENQPASEQPVVEE
jgi:hypothetical protein